MLNLKDLYCFVLVYEMHSFSRAADILDTVQSQVSVRIQRLEHVVGAPLFLRLHRDVRPTRKGELLYRHAKRVIWELAEMESAVKAHDAAAAKPRGFGQAEGSEATVMKARLEALQKELG